MTISHVWTIDALEYADANGIDRVVNKIKWACFSDSGTGHTYNDPGTTIVGPSNPDNFVPFGALTEATVIAWLDPCFIAKIEARGASAVQKLIDAELSDAGVGVPW
jgi:hypothetical protein